MTTIGEKLRQLRIAAGFSAAELGRRARPPCTDRTVLNIETRNTNTRSRRTLRSLFEELGVSFEEAMKGVDMPTRKPREKVGGGRFHQSSRRSRKGQLGHLPSVSQAKPRK